MEDIPEVQQLLDQVKDVSVKIIQLKHPYSSVGSKVIPDKLIHFYFKGKVGFTYKYQKYIEQLPIFNAPWLTHPELKGIKEFTYKCVYNKQQVNKYCYKYPLFDSYFDAHKEINPELSYRDFVNFADKHFSDKPLFVVMSAKMEDRDLLFVDTREIETTPKYEEIEIYILASKILQHQQTILTILNSPDKCYFA